MSSAFDEVAVNKWKSYLLMFLFSLIVISLGYVFGRIYGRGNSGVIISFMIIAFFLSIIIALFSYYTGDKTALSLSNAKIAHKKDYAHLINSVEGLAIAAGIPMPKVYVFPDQSINAFACGRNPENASIAVSKGALDKLNRTELEGVIAHEMSHIKNYDIRLMTIVVILVGLIVLLSDIFLRSMFFRSDDDNGGSGNAIFFVIGIVLAILAPIFAQLIQLAVSRRREYVADANGALLSRHPQGLADALKKIKKDQMETKNASKATAHMYFSSPFRAGFWNNLFSTHPPIDERIRKLEGM